MTRLSALLLCTFLAACAAGPQTAPQSPAVKAPASIAPPPSNTIPPRVNSQTAVRNFIEVITTIEPVAEQVCREQSPHLNCDFLIVYDADPRAPVNAFQKVDDTGRPVIIFTLPLIAEARNTDELAFILSHEAAHHIAGHLARQQQAAIIGATILGNLAVLSNNPETIENAQQLGAALGARTYSKDFELEADALGALIAQRGGYDALRGADFFFRIKDPGNRFLGTHPANADRFRVVQRVARGV